MITFDIMINDPGWYNRDRLEKLVNQAVQAVVDCLDHDVTGELSLVFSNDSEIRNLNNRWRHQDKATNVLSFPVSPLQSGKADLLLGDIVLSRETIEKEAALQGKLFDHHLIHLVIHGFLHLLGYDHEEAQDAEIMESLEQKIVHNLAIPDPYALSLEN